MRIAYLSSSIIPSKKANSVHVMKMCNALTKLGHEVYLFAPDNPESEPLERHKDIFSYYGVEPNFKVIKIPWLPIKGRSIFYGLLAVFRAFRLKVDLVYGRDIIACYFATFLNKPIVYEAHQPISESSFITKYMFSKIKKKKKLKKIVVISEALKKYFVEEEDIAENKIIIAHDGADTLAEKKVGNILPHEIGRGNSIKVGYIGSLYQGRGIGIIIGLAISFKEAIFHIIGGTEKDIQYWKSESGNLENLIFHGFIPNGELSQWYYEFDILLAPYEKKVSIASDSKSDTSKWMSPLKLFEYMAAGKAIITSNHPVLQEILTNRENALLCSPENMNDWEKALAELIENDEFRKKLGKNAKNTFTKKHSWLTRAEDIISNIKD